MLHSATTFAIFIYEGPGSQPMAIASKQALCAALLERGYAVATAGALDAGAQENLLVVGNFGTGTPELEDTQGRVKLQTVDFSDQDIEKVIAAAEGARQGRPQNQPGLWKPWFPVIDYSRCTNCMQCLSFCLFDVYGVSGEGKIQVQNNDNCKTNCPACSRVCPEVAIMFPKYAGGPINGLPVNDTELQREKMKVDISSLLGGNIYTRLKERTAQANSRFSKERDSGKALDERRKCLTKLMQDGLIPAEVLAALPSPDEIRQKAVAAAAKAQAALEAQSAP